MGHIKTDHMKVLIFTSQLHSGAAELLGVELAIGLNQKGIHADVICMYSEKFEGAVDAKEEILKRGVPNVYFLDLNIGPSLKSLICATAHLRHLLRTNGYRIIETSSLAPGIIASVSCIGTSVFHVAGLHQTFYRSEHKSLREKLFASCARVRKKTRFYAVSEFVKKTWVEYSGISDSLVRVIYNCISINADESNLLRNRCMLRSKWCISETSKIVLCVGRLAKYKQQDFVLDALGSICVENDLVVLFVGTTDMFVPGTNEMLQKMEEEIAARRLASRVKFIGYRSDVYELMVSADILVHGTAKEAFGLVLAEAMALGLPIVATHVEAIPEVLHDTDYILVPPNDPMMLQKAVLKALTLSPDQAAQAKAKGKLRAQMFTQSTRTREIVELFEDILCGRF